MELRGTTIVAVKKDGKTVIAGDGQVTAGQSVVMKSNAVKVRRLYDDKVVIGFAGSVADAFTLSERFEGMLHKYSGNLMRSAVELAQLWRGDKILRHDDSSRRARLARCVRRGRRYRARKRNMRDRKRRQLRACGGSRTCRKY